MTENSTFPHTQAAKIPTMVNIKILVQGILNKDIISIALKLLIANMYKEENV